MSVIDRTGQEAEVAPRRGTARTAPSDNETPDRTKRKDAKRDRRDRRVTTPLGTVSRRPGRIRLVLLLLVAVFLGVMAGALVSNIRNPAQQIVTAGENPFYGSALAGAEQCVRLWLNAGADAHDTLTNVCQPASVNLDGQTAGSLQAVTATAIPGALSPQEQPNYWSVLVATEVVGRAPDGGVENLAVKFYRVGVYVDQIGAWAIRKLPRQVSMPVASAVPDPLLGGADTTTANMSDPRVQVIASYLQNYYIEGSVANYLDSSIAPLEVHDPDITAVEVVGVSFSQPSENATSTQADVTMHISYGEGRTTVQSVSLGLERTNQVWVINSIDLAAALKPQGN